MAIKGAVSKENVTKKILEVFPGAFIVDKELRIPMIEDGVEVQIKVALTAAKTNIAAGVDPVASIGVQDATKQPLPQSEVSEDEKELVSALLKKLR